MDTNIKTYWRLERKTVGDWEILSTYDNEKDAREERDKHEDYPHSVYYHLVKVTEEIVG